MIKFRLRALIGHQETVAGHKITYDDIAGATGLSRNTIYNLANNRTCMIKLETIRALCQFFGCQPGDLFYMM